MYSIVVIQPFLFRNNMTKVGARMMVDQKVFDYLMKKWGKDYLREIKGPNEHQLAAKAIAREQTKKDETSEE